MVVQRVIRLAVGLFVLGVADLHAQSGRVDLKVSGAIGQFYIDESFPDHFELGVSARVGLSSRWAIEPELGYIESNVDFLPDEWNYVFVTNVVRHFGDAEARARLTGWWEAACALVVTRTTCFWLPAVLVSTSTSGNGSSSLPRRVAQVFVSLAAWASRSVQPQ